MVAHTSDLHGRYASALFELADEAGQLESVESDLGRLRAFLRESGDLRALVRSPLFRRSEQSEAILAVARQAGFSELTVRFLGLVATKRRLFALVGMIEAFDRLLDRKRGLTRVEVRAAGELDDESVAALVEALRVATGGEVALDAKADPELVGGLVVRVGSRMIDTSIRSRLKRMRLRMREAG